MLRTSENTRETNSQKPTPGVYPSAAPTGSPLSDHEIQKKLRLAAKRLGVPWNYWIRLNERQIKRTVLAELARLEIDISQVCLVSRFNILNDVVDRAIGPYRNRLTLVSYAFLIGAVGTNAMLISYLRHSPSLAAFVATFGGTLAGAMGFQVIARWQAWAKQVSSNGGRLRKEHTPFTYQSLDTWRRSQQMKSDLLRDGRNIRKDGWLQLHRRFEKALTFHVESDALEAVADALIDHRQSYGEVLIDYWMGREFHRNLKHRFANENAYQAIRRIFRDTAFRHRLPVAELDRALAIVLRPETWRRDLARKNATADVSTDAESANSIAA